MNIEEIMVVVQALSERYGGLVSKSLSSVKTVPSSRVKRFSTVEPHYSDLRYINILRNNDSPRSRFITTAVIVSCYNDTDSSIHRTMKGRNIINIPFLTNNKFHHPVHILHHGHCYGRWRNYWHWIQVQSWLPRSIN